MIFSTNTQSLLHLVKQDGLSKIQISPFHEKPSVVFVKDATMYTHGHGACLSQIVVREREKTLSLCVKHALDTISQHIQIARAG